MPNVGNLIFKWDAPCLEQELIRWKSVTEGNFKVNTTANKLFEGPTWTDSIDIFPETSGNINSHSRDVQVDNVYQKQKSQAFTYIQLVCRVEIQVHPIRSNVGLTVEQEPK